MSTAQTLMLGAGAGLTIFLGLPIGRMQNVSANVKAFLSATATSVLIFLLWDVLSTAVDPIDSALKAGRDGRFLWLAFLLTVGFGVGVLTLGQAWTSQAVSIVFLALAAGSILYVVIELLNVGRVLASKMLVTWGVLLGLFLGFATDFILIAAGA